MTDAQEATLRFECLQAMCSQIATGTNNARTVLRDNAEDANVSYLVANALDRLGWMADRAAVVAGSDVPMVAGDAEGWILGEDVQDALRKIEAGGVPGEARRSHC